MYKSFGISKKTIDFINAMENELSIDFHNIESIYEHNQLKVLKALIDNEISESHFNESTGYGYNDIGRDKLESVYSNVFNTEDALVRQQFVSGTHAISLALSAILRPRDKILSITGLPYDTLYKTIGLTDNNSSLKSYGIDFDYVELTNNDFDYVKINEKLKNKPKLIMIQRSRGYSENYPISITKIKKIIDHIKTIDDDIIIFVDNCYGEFVELNEPTDFGADLMCGSLIKNPGGSLAKSGAYIVGKKNLIELCAERLTAPGIGKEVGINFNQNRNVIQGLYLAPQIVSNALKINKLFAKSLNYFNIQTIPMHDEEQNDIVLSIIFNDKDRLTNFCNIIQSTSPVDSFLKPISDDMPGYDDEVIMAAGTFVSGSSIELSCDAPIRPPYIAFLQGGITYYQGKLALMKTIDKFQLL